VSCGLEVCDAGRSENIHGTVLGPRSGYIDSVIRGESRVDARGLVAAASELAWISWASVPPTHVASVRLGRPELD